MDYTCPLLLLVCVYFCWAVRNGFQLSQLLSDKENACNAGAAGDMGLNPWRRAWQTLPVFLPGESRGQGRLAGCSPWDRKESDMTEMT